MAAAKKTEVAEVEAERIDLNAPTGTEVQTSTGFELSAELMSEVADLGDLGYSEKQEDSMIPILAVLQDNSGEVKQRHSKRIDGAKAGDLIIRSIAKVIDVDSDGPIVFQPCAFQHVWVEWQGDVGEGVPVGQFNFESPPEDTREVADPENPDRKMLIRENGNRLVDTRYHFGYMLTDEGAMPLVVPMSGTNHTVSRQWTAQMNQFRMSNGLKAPAFFRKYSLSTKYRERGPQSWFNYVVKDLGAIQDENVLRAGLDMLKSFKDNKIAADVAGMGEGGGGAPSDPDDLPI